MTQNFFTRKDPHWTTRTMLSTLMLFIAPLANAATTNIVYTLNTTPPQIYKANQRLMLRISWQTSPHATGFAHIRLLSQNPESATAPALSALLNADGSFDMVPAGRGLALRLPNLTAGNTAASHTADIQIYPSLNSTKLAGDFSATWPHPLDTAAISGSAQVVMCGEGITLATVSARWQPNPTLFWVK